MTTKHQLTAIGVALMALTPLPSFGQSDTHSIKLDELLVQAPPPSPLAEAWKAGRISIDPKELSLYQPQTTADLLGSSGRVYIQKSQQGGGSPMIRGFATNRLLYSVDGVRMNTAIYRSGNIHNVISLDPLAMEQAQVLFGSGSVLYGSDAIGGVMDFRTLSPKLSGRHPISISGSTSARYASANNERTGHFDFQISLRRWAFLTSISNFEFGDLKQGSYGPEDYLKPFVVRRADHKADLVLDNPDPRVQTPSAYSQSNIMQKILYKPSDAWQMEYAFHLSESSPYGRYDRHNRLRKGLPRYAVWSYGPQKWMMNLLHLSHTMPSLLYDQIDLRLALQNFEESRIDRALNKPIRSTQTEQVNAYSLNLDLKKTTAKAVWNYGVEYVLDRVKSMGEAYDIEKKTSERSASRYPQASWHSAGAYLQGAWTLAKGTEAYAGARYNLYRIDANFTNPGFALAFDAHQTNQAGSLSGNLGLNYQPTQFLTFNLNLSRGFRAPNVDDMGKIFDSVDQSVVVPNPTLKPEYAHGIDVTARGRFSWGEVELSGFYTHLTNALVRRPFRLPSGEEEVMYKGELSRVLAIQNAAFAEVYGAYLLVRTKEFSGLSAFAEVNYQRGREELDDRTSSPLRHAAPLFARAGLDFSTKSLRICLESRMQAERKHTDLPLDERGKTEIYAKDEAGRTYSPAWLVLNLRSHYQISRRWAVTAAIENITDRRYRPYSSGISGAGRSLVLSTTHRF